MHSYSELILLFTSAESFNDYWKKSYALRKMPECSELISFLNQSKRIPQVSFASSGKNEQSPLSVFKDKEITINFPNSVFDKLIESETVFNRLTESETVFNRLTESETVQFIASTNEYYADKKIRYHLKLHQLFLKAKFLTTEQCDRATLLETLQQYNFFEGFTKIYLDDLIKCFAEDFCKDESNEKTASLALSTGNEFINISLCAKDSIITYYVTGVQL